MSTTKKLKLEELNRVDLPTFKKLKKIPVVVILDNIRSMHNVGSLFRTSDAFVVEKIVLGGITPRPPHREIQKSALGATESVEWIHTENTVEVLTELRLEGYEILGIEQTTSSIPLQEFTISPEAKYAIVLGNEVDGISEEVLGCCTAFIEIPQSGTKHSLNVSVCGSIILWEFYRTLELKY